MERVDQTGWLLMERIPERYGQVVKGTAVTVVLHDLSLAEVANSAEIWPMSGDELRSVLESAQINN